MVFFGRVQWAKADSYSLIRTKTANLRVAWAGGGMPPDVYIGRTVAGAGKLKTWDGGRMVMVVEAVPFPDGRKALQAFAPLLDELAADPTDWAPEIIAKRFPRA